MYESTNAWFVSNIGNRGKLIADIVVQTTEVYRVPISVWNCRDSWLLERPDQLNDPRIVEKWNELTQIFTQNEESTIAYLNSCCKENIDWISEIFEDISEKLQSSGFIECIEQLVIKYPDLNLEQDVLYAKEVLK